MSTISANKLKTNYSSTSTNDFTAKEFDLTTAKEESCIEEP